MKNIFRKLIRNILKILWIFPINDNKVYLTNFDGKNYSHDSKAFAEYLIKNYGQKYKIYWEVSDKKSFVCDNNLINLVNKRSFFSIYHSLSAKILMFNFVPRSYLPYRKEQKIINTWHGNPIKKVGKYAMHYNAEPYLIPTAYISHSEYYSMEILRDSFNYTGKILNIGAPRNDIFFSGDVEKEKKRISILNRLHLQNKKILLYAPTFRGDFNNSDFYLDSDNVIKELNSKFGGEWIILNRLHPMLSSSIKTDNPNEYDVSGYPDMQELLLVSDILITDYSSSIWDFTLQRKPAFIYAKDINAYEKNRGFYMDINKLPYPLATNEIELVELIREFSLDKYLNDLNSYFINVNSYEEGNSCKKILEYINEGDEKNEI